MLNDTQQSFLKKIGVSVSDSGSDGARSGEDPASAIARTERLLKQVRGLSPRGVKLLKPLTDPVATALTGARQKLDAGDGEAAAALLDAQAEAARTLDREMDTVKTYVVEDEKFRTRLAATRAHRKTGGLAAIDTYLERMENDDKRRQTAEAKGDFTRALAACEARDHRHTAMMQEAERAVEFQALQREIEGEIAKIEAKAPDGGQARPVIEDVREMIGDAGNFTKSDNWVGAVLMLRKARTELSVRTKGIELIQQLSPEEKNDDYEMAFKRVQAMVEGLRKLPSSARFVPELKSIVDTLRQSRGALPDEAKAQDYLQTARSAAIEMTEGMLEDGKVLSSFQQVMRQRAELKKVNRDRCVQPELKRLNTAIWEAEEQERRNDFVAALEQLDIAGKAAAEGNAAARVYEEFVAPARRAVAQIARDGDRAEAEQKLATLDQAFRDRDLRACESLAREALKTAES